MSALWPQLVSTALVGTQRRPAATPVPDSLASLIPLPEVRSEVDLLSAAGALTLARRAGAAATTGVPAPVPCAPEDQPLAPYRAQMRLRFLLGSASDVTLIELWLALAAERGVVVAGHDLPDLFRLGRQHEPLRRAIVAVAGQRGAWLAGQRPQWRWVTDGRIGMVEVDDERAWFEGELPDRAAYLATMRRRDPAAGRELLAGVWSQEPPAERATLLQTLSVGLGPEDEEFCEAALDDRRKEVRAVAVTLLGNLGDSAYTRRMSARALGWVATLGGGLLVVPPTECDAAMKRDGVDPKPGYGIGERAWWFEQVVSATPIAVWAALGDPAHLAGCRVTGGWAPSLRRSWARATVRAGDRAWAGALIATGFGTGSSAEPADRELAASLYAILPSTDVLAAARTAFATATTPNSHVIALARALPQPWPRDLVTTLLGYLGAQIRAVSDPPLPPQIRELAASVIAALPLDAAADVNAFVESIFTEHPSMASTVGPLATTAKHRHQILLEFS